MTVSDHEFQSPRLHIPGITPKCWICGKPRAEHVAQAVDTDWVSGGAMYDADDPLVSTFELPPVTGVTESGQYLHGVARPDDILDISPHTPHLPDVSMPDLGSALSNASNSLSDLLSSASDALSGNPSPGDASGGGSGGFDSTPSYDSGTSSYDSGSSNFDSASSS